MPARLKTSHMNKINENGSNLPAVFTFGETNKVRIINNSQPWFAGTDVCKSLGIKNTTQAINRLDDDERCMFNIGRQGKTWFVNESGVYNLIFRSDKPEAKQFRKWVTNEVLPALRKDGTYDGVTLKSFSDKQWVTQEDFCTQCGKTFRSFFGNKTHYPTEFLYVHGQWFMSSELFETIVMQHRVHNRKSLYRLRRENLQLSLFS